MRSLTAVIASAILLAGPTVGYAQPYQDDGWRPADSYGADDPCGEARHEAGQNGAVEGGLLGALAGAAVAGRGSRVGGAVIGGAVGAVAGNAIGRDSVRCEAYPYGYHRHPHCRWVDDHGHQFEVCRGHDGYWRPRRY